MIGRGLLANPNLARAIHCINDDLAPPAFSWADAAKLVHLFFIDSCQSYPEKFMGNRVKQWLHYLQQEFPEAELLFEEIKRLREFTPINEAILRSQYAEA